MKRGVELRARADFEAAARKGFWYRLIHWITRTNNQLLPFNEVRRLLPLGGQREIGLREVPIDRIIGSVGRYDDFDRAFRPRRPTSRPRWESIDEAHLQDIILPNVDLYKVGNAYFVKDGNHRVSVAREKGQAFIDANVIEIDSPIPINSDMNLAELIDKHEYAGFVDKTDIFRLRPDVRIELSEKWQYSTLIEHINVHRWFLGEALHREVSYEEAVLHWFDNLYLPVVEVIRKGNILKEFPERTEADLYLWIMDHTWYLMERSGEEVSLDEVAEDFFENYSRLTAKRLVKIVDDAARQVLEGPDLQEKE